MPLVCRLAVLTAALLLPCGSLAQSAAPATPKSATPAALPPVISPEIHADRRVTFRLRAPRATSVTITGQFQKGPAVLTKDESGLWSVTVGPVAPDIYEYSFNVDGLAMIDPANRAIKPMRAPRTSILHLPANPPRVHDFQAVPHGKVSLHTYVSQSLGRPRPMQVYTPPGYDADPTRRYPTLYLFHGSGDNEATWVAHGHAHWILDNLIAAGRGATDDRRDARRSRDSPGRGDARHTAEQRRAL
jgi:enterochelin esterase family protein